LVIIRCLNTRSQTHNTTGRSSQHHGIHESVGGNAHRIFESRNGRTAVSTNSFNSENPVILNLKDVLDNTVYGDEIISPAVREVCMGETINTNCHGRPRRRRRDNTEPVVYYKDVN
jgi:hypothetical protein